MQFLQFLSRNKTKSLKATNTVEAALNSKVFKGWVRHRRFSPTQNAFKYTVFMMYLDLAEIDQVLSRSWLWSRSRFALARFKRSDFFGDSSQPLDLCIRDYVEKNLGKRPDGPIRVLANLRYFGFIINPITIYYCFDASGDALEAIVAEVNNTPWNERHAYVLPVNGAASLNYSFEKAMHVSPFNPMAMRYKWFSNVPSSHLSVHLENWQDLTTSTEADKTQAFDPQSGQQPVSPQQQSFQQQSFQQQEKIMDATLVLQAQTITQSRLTLALILYPFMTVKVVGAIYWQALKLWLKRTPFYSHS